MLYKRAKYFPKIKYFRGLFPENRISQTLNIRNNFDTFKQFKGELSEANILNMTTITI